MPMLQHSCNDNEMIMKGVGTMRAEQARVPAGMDHQPGTDVAPAIDLSESRIRVLRWIHSPEQTAITAGEVGGRLRSWPHTKTQRRSPIWIIALAVPICFIENSMNQLV